MNLVEIAADARPDLHALRRFKPTDVFVPLDDLARDGHYDGNGWWWWRGLCGVLSCNPSAMSRSKARQTQPDILISCDCRSKAGWNGRDRVVHGRKIGVAPRHS
jgi:hypothetical protein